MIMTDSAGEEELVLLDLYVKKLCNKALNIGASEAVAMDVQNIIVDRRTRLKCFVPLCPKYGNNLMCPPNIMDVAEFEEILKSYHMAVLLKVAINQSIATEELSNNKCISEMWERAASASVRIDCPQNVNYFDELIDAQRKLFDIVSQLESYCNEDGFIFSVGLGAGSCCLCNECVGQQSGLPCRHPFQARPSMEAVGIDVVNTAKIAGIDLSFIQNNNKCWVGLLLVD